MAGQINTIMATDVALNTLPANQALSGLRKAVDAIGKSYEAQARQAEDAGNAAKASALRHQGLTEQIDKQSKMVDSLAKQQAHLTDVAKDQASAMENVKQREKETKDAMKAEADAVSKTSDKYKQLKAQLKDIQAERREIKYAPNNLLKVSRQLETARIKLNDLQRAEKAYNPTIGQRISSSLDRANRALANSKHNVGSFKSVLVGTFAGQTLTNAAASAWGAIKMGIGAAVSAGVNFAKQNQVMMATWTTLTGTATGAKGIVSDITTVSNALGQPIELTDELEQQFYHVFNNREQSTQLTKSFETMGDAIGLTSDRLQQVGQDFTHMMSSSVLHLGELNQIQDAFPMFGEALLKYEQQVQHNGSLTMNQLRKQISAGKVQSQDAVNVMNQLGHKYKSASDNLMKTLPGMGRQIKAKLKQELGNAMSPLMTSTSPVYEAVSNWTKDPKTDAEFKKLGQKLNNSVQNVLKAYSGGGNSSTIANGLNNVVEKIGDTIQRVSSFLIRNRSTIQASFSLIGNTGKAAFAILKQSIKDVIGFFSAFTGGSDKAGNSSQSTAQQIQSLSNAMQALSKNQAAIKALAGVLLTLFMINKANQFANFIKNLTTGTLAQLVKRLVNIKDGFGHVKNGASKALSIIKKVATFSKGTAVKSFQLLKSGALKAASGMKTLASVSKRVLLSSMRTVASMARGAMVSALSAMSRGVRAAAAGVRAFNLALKSNPIILVISLITSLIAAFVALYRHNARFRDFVNGLVKSIASVAQKVVKYSPPYLLIQWFEKLYNHNRAFRNFINGIVNTVKNTFSNLFKFFEQKFDWLKKQASDVWNDVRHPLGGGSQRAHYAAGTSGTTEDQIAVVNDAKDKHYREGLFYNGMLIPFPARRNLTTLIPAGAQVINGEAMHELKKQQLPHYADGLGALNSFITGENAYGKGQREAVYRDFLAKVNAEYKKQRKQFLAQIAKAKEAEAKAQQKAQIAINKARQKLAEAQAKAQKTLKNAIQKASDAFAKAIQKMVQTRNQKIANAQAVFKRNHDVNAYNEKLAEAYQTSQQTYAKAMQTKQQALSQAQQTNQQSNDTAEKTFDASYNTATKERRNTIFEQSQIIKLANQNLQRLDAWRQSNLEQFKQANANFATGGIADRPSIFGEAGPEAAIPLDQMQQGNAWSLLQRVVNYYAGGESTQPNQQAPEESAKLDQLHKDLNSLNTLVQRLISGQGAQIQATKGINGYDKNQAGADMSEYIKNAWNSGLTM